VAHTWSAWPLLVRRGATANPYQAPLSTPAAAAPTRTSTRANGGRHKALGAALGAKGGPVQQRWWHNAKAVRGWPKSKGVLRRTAHQREMCSRKPYWAWNEAE
jgi:hypothetical protein